jgi:glycosyl transferase family 87
MSSIPGLGSAGRDSVLRFFAALVLVAGCYAANSRVLSLWLPFGNWENGGVDYVVLHAMARGIVERINVYALNDPDAVGPGVVGMVYPPATGFAVFPLAYLPFEVARAVFFIVSNLILILGVRTLVRHLAPQSDSYLWMITAGLVLLSASVRWGMMLLQIAPLIVGLLCLLIVAIDLRHWRTAIVVATLATALKMTLALPFLGLLLLHRRFLGVGIAVGCWLILNALGFLLMGDAAFSTYQANVAKFEVLDASWNINGPDPWLGISLPRLDWVFLFYGTIRDLPLSRLISLSLAGATALWLLREGWYFRRTADTLEKTYLFLTPLVCLGSLAVYHHHYDASLFLVPILLAYFLPSRLRKPTWGVWLCIPLLLTVLVLPIGATQNVLEKLFGPPGAGLLKISFPLVVTLALIGSLSLLRCSLNAKAKLEYAIGTLEKRA